MPIGGHDFDYDVVVIGGLGHVGLPLGIVFADKGLNVCLFDLGEEKANEVRAGKMPFIEYGAEPLLAKVLEAKRLHPSTDPKDVARARFVVVAIGTPIDEYLNPKTRQFLELFSDLKDELSPKQTIVIRSTVYPRTTEQVARRLAEQTPGEWHVAYCPERIIQGYAVKELVELPQLVSGTTEQAVKDATQLFATISPKIIEVSPVEAELAKLFANAWRYLQFATTNQFYMISHAMGVDYNRVRMAMRDGYKRAETLPTPGFAAGPCLLKDTMQLAAFSANSFLLGHAAMMINEGLPNYLVEDLRTRHDLRTTKIGILGMAFKADIDDVRDSLSFKLGKILRFHGAKIYYSDEYATNPDFVPKETLVKESDVIIVAVPHSAYKGLEIPKGKEVVDLWGVVQSKP